MQWVKINNIFLTNTWQFLNASGVEGNLFRLTQSWDIYPQGAKALIVQSLSINPLQFFGTKSFYPSENLRIINLSIPKDFVTAGISSRYLLMKFYSKRQFTFNWSITVEAFTNS